MNPQRPLAGLPRAGPLASSWGGSGQPGLVGTLWPQDRRQRPGSQALPRALAGQGGDLDCWGPPRVRANLPVCTGGPGLGWSPAAGMRSAGPDRTYRGEAGRATGNRAKEGQGSRAWSPSPQRDQQPETREESRRGLGGPTKKASPVPIEHDRRGRGVHSTEVTVTLRRTSRGEVQVVSREGRNEARGHTTQRLYP